jgi:hypothetical protein
LQQRFPFVKQPCQYKKLILNSPRVALKNYSHGINIGHICTSGQKKSIKFIIFTTAGGDHAHSKQFATTKEPQTSSPQGMQNRGAASDLWPINRACGAHFIKRQTLCWVPEPSVSPRAHQQFMQAKVSAATTAVLN